MNAKTLLLVVGLVVGAAAGWLANDRLTSTHTHGSDVESGGRKIAFYQSSMHPWIKSDRPGRCTICGMELVPVYEGDPGFAADPDIVSLSTNSITVVGVQTAPVRRGNLHRSIRFAGTVDDDDSRHRILSAYSEGRIEALHVHYTGAEVKMGQPLARFYSPMLLAAVREFLALRAAPGAAHPARDAVGASTAVALHQAAGLRLRQLGLTDSQIDSLPQTFGETNLAVDVVAPMSGTVVKRMVYAGQYVREGDPMFELGDFSVMWLKIDAYERDLPWIRVGQPVEVTTPSVPGTTFQGRIAFIDPNLDEATRSAKVRVELENPLLSDGPSGRRRFMHRTYAEARVEVEQPDVLTLPRESVLNPDGQPVVFVDRGGGAYARVPVTLGRFGDDQWEVVGGVAEGELVVTHGNLLLDSQSQLSRQAGPVPVKETDAPTRPGKPVAATPLGTFLAAIDSQRAALAADDLKAFNAGRQKVSETFAAFSAAADHAVWHEAILKLTPRVALPEARDLTAARQSFFALNVVLVDSLPAARKQDPSLKGLKIYECPMTDSAFPDAPKRARWFQLSGPLQNPWFGARMLTCGAEVKP